MCFIKRTENIRFNLLGQKVTSQNFKKVKDVRFDHTVAFTIMQMRATYFKTSDFHPCIKVTEFQAEFYLPIEFLVPAHQNGASCEVFETEVSQKITKDGEQQMTAKFSTDLVGASRVQRMLGV